MSYQPPFPLPTAQPQPPQLSDHTRALIIRERELDLQIATERRKEREAELEILRLRAGQPGTGVGGHGVGVQGTGGGGQDVFGIGGSNSGQPQLPGLAYDSALNLSSYTSNSQYPAALPSQPTYPLQTQYPQYPAPNPQTQSFPTSPQTHLSPPTTSFLSPDFFDWLPSSPSHSQALPEFPPVPSAGGFANSEEELRILESMFGSSAVPARSDPQPLPLDILNPDLLKSAFPNGLPSAHPSPALPSQPLPASSSNTGPQPNPPAAAASSSKTSPHPQPSHSGKKSAKKDLHTLHASCLSCSLPVAKLLVKTSPLGSYTLTPSYRCLKCASGSLGRERKGSVGGSAGVGIGSVSGRKRRRQEEEAIEGADTWKGKEKENGVKREQEGGGGGGRCICDVCQRLVGVGGVESGRHEGEGDVGVEVVCVSCDGKYSRCTDCGGGGGNSRLGIGKWRAKEMFLPGRKTCRLSHSRVGDRTVEIGVWETPTDIPDSNILEEVLTRCKSMWVEKTLARLAIPEVLECDDNGDPTRPLRTYSDVEKKLERGWPIREEFIRNRDNDPNKIRRFIGLTWTPIRSRRGTPPGVDAERQKKTGGGVEDMGTVLPNVKKTHDIIPAGSELTFQWVGEWNIQASSLLISTSIPFDGSDGEDRSALSVGEMITKITSIIQQKRGEGQGVGGWPGLEHLWVVSRNASLLVRERLADVLIRKRHFVTVDEYLTRFPGFRASLIDRPGGLHPDLLPTEDDHDLSTGQPLPPLVLVRWLGNVSLQNKERLDEMKAAEFSGGRKGKGGKGGKKVAKIA